MKIENEPTELSSPGSSAKIVERPFSHSISTLFRGLELPTYHGFLKVMSPEDLQRGNVESRLLGSEMCQKPTKLLMPKVKARGEAYDEKNHWCKRCHKPKSYESFALRGPARYVCRNPNCPEYVRFFPRE